jgi:hypothetical protein
MYYLKGNLCSVYCDRNDRENLLLVDHDMLVINGDWYLEKIDGVFVAPLTKNPINIILLGSIIYDGDYNRTLIRFQNGEGTHISEEQPIIEKPINELCKKQYYGIACYCFKCKR